MEAALRHEKLVMPIKFGKQKTSKSTFLSTSALIKAAVLSAVFGFSAIGTAHAQDAQPFSFGDMLAANGGPLQLPLGITATATPITTGTGVSSANHGNTNLSPASIGGLFRAGDTGFDESNRTIGLPIDTTRISVDSANVVDNGSSNGYADTIGLKVSFSSPIPTSYFYAMDIDGTPSTGEWKTSFGFNGTSFITPTISLASNTRLQVTTVGVDNTGWAGDIPLSGGQAVPSNVDIVSVMTTASGVQPDDHRNQLIFDYDNQPLTDIYFLFGRVGGVARGGSNSGLSALFLTVPEFDVGKGGVAGPLLPDGTVDVTYTVDVENSGGVDFTGVSIEDVLTFPATIVSPPTIITGPADPGSAAPTANAAYTGVAPNAGLLTPDSNVLASGDSFQVEFTVNATASGSISNIAQTSGEPVGFAGSFADDGSDPDTDADGNPDTTPNVPGGPGIATITNLPAALPSLDFTKTADSTGPHAPGDVVTYTYTATNDGNVNINDVTVSDVHNGSAPLGPLTLGTLTNTSGLSSDDGTDLLIDVLSPGDAVDFTAQYVVTATDLIAGGAVTNTATATGTPIAGTLTPPTANESISLSGTPRPALTPGVCGSFVREGFIIDPGSSATEVNADFGSGAAGPAPFDPYVLEPLFGRNASTGVVSFYQTSADDATTGSFLSDGVALSGADQLTRALASDPNPESEIWRLAARVDGAPGTTETLTIQNTGAHEHTAYWQTDVNGAIINTNSSSNAGQDDGWIFGTTTPTVGADGISYTIDVTYPADGIVILQFALLDSTGGFGGIIFDDYECPAPSLSMTKVADSEGPHTAGDVVTYTYTVTNDGNQNINDVAIADTHNGSDPAPIPGNETLLTDAAPTGDSTDASVDGSWDVLAPGDTLTFTGTYTITQIDAENL